MVKSSSPEPTAPPPVVGAPAGVIYLEWTKCSAAWRGTTSVDITANGYIRKEYCDVRLTSQGWKDIQADGDVASKGALVIWVEEVASPNQGTAPRRFYRPDNVVAPPELSNPSNTTPEVVFCGFVPGPDVDTPPPVLGQMKKTRIRVV